MEEARERLAARRVDAGHGLGGIRAEFRRDVQGLGEGEPVERSVVEEGRRTAMHGRVWWADGFFEPETRASGDVRERGGGSL